MSFATQLRHTLRRLARTPLFTAITLATLAIGIGADSAIFSVLRGVLLKPLPYDRPEALVAISGRANGMGGMRVDASPSMYFTIRDYGRAFEDVALYESDKVTITGLSEPERINTMSATDGLLRILRVRPFIGRDFTRKDAEPGSPPTLLLSYGYWQKRFGGDPQVLGRRIVVDGTAQEIIGVLPRNFRFYRPQSAFLSVIQFNRKDLFIGNFGFAAVGRLRPGVTVTEANADVARTLALMIEKYPPAPGMSLDMIKNARISPVLRSLKDEVVGDIGRVLWVLMGVVAIVLFIACANVANLLLVRAEGRQQELAVRAAIGASRRQVAGDLLFESATVGVLGGVLGTAVAYGVVKLLIAIGPATLPRLEDVAIDGPVLLFTFSVALVAGLLFGLVPVAKYAGLGLANALRDGGRSASEGRDRHRARNVLVVTQVALALVLLISSGLMIRTFQALRHVDPGFSKPEQALTFRTYIPEGDAKKAEEAIELERRIVDKLAALPGVQSAALANSVPMDGITDHDPVIVQEKPGPAGQIPPLRYYKFIGPGFVKTAGERLVAGRDMNWTDVHEKRNVAMMSENMAREYFSSPAEAIGKHVRETDAGVWHEVIGVIGDVHDDGADQPAPKIIYYPLINVNFWGRPIDAQRSVAFVLRSDRAGSATLLDEARRALWSVDPRLPVAEAQTLGEIYSHSMERTSFALVMLGISAGMALVLGVLGIYGVISYTVAQKGREIGIRIALGAPHGSVQRLFVRQAMLLAGTGALLGVAMALALTRLMKALLYGVSPIDPVTYVAVCAVLVGSALLASYLPARRATLSVDPADALRAQ